MGNYKNLGADARMVFNMVGQVCAELTVLGQHSRDADGHWTWKCRCSCGGERVAKGHLLRYGTVKDCGNRAIHPLKRTKLTEEQEAEIAEKVGRGVPRQVIQKTYGISASPFEIPRASK